MGPPKYGFHTDAQKDQELEHRYGALPAEAQGRPRSSGPRSSLFSYRWHKEPRNRITSVEAVVPVSEGPGVFRLGALLSLQSHRSHTGDPIPALLEHQYGVRSSKGPRVLLASQTFRSKGIQIHASLSDWALLQRNYGFHTGAPTLGLFGARVRSP